MKSQNNNNLVIELLLYALCCTRLATFSHFIFAAILRQQVSCSPFSSQGDEAIERFQNLPWVMLGSEPRYSTHSFPVLNAHSETGTVPGVH